MMKMVPAALTAALLTGTAALAADNFWTGAAPPAKAAPPQTAAQVAPGLPGIETLERTLEEAWERAPLTQRHAVFVAEKPELYGGYVERPGRSFAQGEKLVTYIEPVGYTWKPVAEGRYEFGFTLDFKVKRTNGKILAGQDAFQSFDFVSRFKNREVFMNITMTLDGIEPGDYVLVYTLHDKGSDKASSFEQPFTIQG